MIDGEAQARSWIKELASDDKAIPRLDHLVDLLVQENKKQNLVASATLAKTWQRHFADSAQLLRFVSGGPKSWLDLGSGAGFPGLVIAILQPAWNVTLAESRALRCQWLDAAIASLELPNAKVANGRVEKLVGSQFDAISARAFASLSDTLSLSARFSTSDTLWLLPKGRSAKQELSELKGWRHAFHVEQSLTDSDAGIIVGHLLGRQGHGP